MGPSQSRPESAGVPADVLEFVRAGTKLEAIKRDHELAASTSRRRVK
jgi:hypothetical protein